MRFRKRRQGSWWQLENCLRPQGTDFEGDWGIIVLCSMFQCFLYFVSSSVNVSIFYTAWYLLDRPRIHKYIVYILNSKCIFLNIENNYEILIYKCIHKCIHMHIHPMCSYLYKTYTYIFHKDCITCLRSYTVQMVELGFRPSSAAPECTF